MSMKRSYWLVSGLILASCLIVLIIAIGLPLNGQTDDRAAQAGHSVPLLQGQLDPVSLDAAFPQAPSSIRVYPIRFVNTIRSANGATNMKVKDSTPSSSEAPALAEKALEKYGGLPKDARLIDPVPRYQYRYNVTTHSSEEAYPWQTQVRYIQTVDNYPVIGAGINLGLGQQGEITSIVKIWPVYDSPGNEVIIIPAQAAYEKLKNHETVEKMQGSQPAGSKITDIRLGYKLVQGDDPHPVNPHIIPVWIFSVTPPFDSEPSLLTVDATA